ncbi:MAG: class I SAM-dependent methyltransferase [Acidobacteriota bacterium]
MAQQLGELGSWKRRLSFLAGRHTPHWCRVVMDRSTAAWVNALGPQNLDVLEVSGGRWGAKNFRSYRRLDFPEYDLCAGPLDGADFDLVIVEQVLEHVVEPAKAVAHARAMLRPGGHLLVSTPFLIRYHGAPDDYSRWTALGLGQLLEGAGFAAAAIKTSSWGNRACVIATLDRWAKYRPLRHSLRDDPRFPVVVWALAQR